MPATPEIHLLLTVYNNNNNNNKAISWVREEGGNLSIVKLRDFPMILERGNGQLKK